MDFRHHRLRLGGFVVLLAAALALALAGCMGLWGWPAALVGFGAALWVLSGMFRELDRTNRDLIRWLEAIRYGDFTQSFGEAGRGGSCRDLSRAFGDVVRDFQSVRAREEESRRYLQTVIQHLGVGLISFGPEGDVDLVNNQACRLLRVPFLKNVRTLMEPCPELVEALFRLKAGEKAMVRLFGDGEPVHLSLRAAELRLQGRPVKLVTLHDIQGELEQRETEAWQVLTRVLTHEIMNSMTPIASLSATARERVDALSRAWAGTLGEEDAERLEDAREAVATIHTRSLGLMSFVQAYRGLALIPQPSFRQVLLAGLFDRVGQLMASDFQAAAIALEVRVDPATLEVTADPALLEQVLLNLLLNARDALQGQSDRKVTLEGILGERGRVLVRVTDNGPGIAPEALEKVFVPFFSTRPHGSGIGLSFSRQVMHMHHGSITVHSVPGSSTVFTLRL